ncbi:MAG: hypothetical protein D6816_10630 [Bacteroidetes bacterium]|nr:MAG: hypothetical protein D6816_10630 [Bacteroidota bacterium]
MNSPSPTAGKNTLLKHMAGSEKSRAFETPNSDLSLTPFNNFNNSTIQQPKRCRRQPKLAEGD